MTQFAGSDKLLRPYIANNQLVRVKPLDEPDIDYSDFFDDGDYATKTGGAFGLVAAAGSSAGLFVVAGADYEVNSLVGLAVVPMHGANLPRAVSPRDVYAPLPARIIAANTEDTLTLEANFEHAIAAGDRMLITPPFVACRQQMMRIGIGLDDDEATVKVDIFEFSAEANLVYRSQTHTGVGDGKLIDIPAAYGRLFAVRVYGLTGDATEARVVMTAI